MFCGKCGNKLSDDAKFCGICGETVKQGAATPTPAVAASGQQAPPGAGALDFLKKMRSKMGKGGIVAAAVVALAVVAFAGYQIVANTGRNYLYSTLRRTQRAYSGELNELVSRNPVLKVIKDNFSGAYTQQLKITGAGSITLRDDTKSKIYQLEARLDALPFNPGLYLSDDALILGAKTVGYYEINPRAIGSDVGSLLDNLGRELLGDLSYLDETLDMLDTYDLSYSKLHSLNISTKSSDYRAIEKFFTDQLINLVKRMKYERESSNFDLSDKTVKADLVTLTIDSRVLSDWANKDLLPAAARSRELREYWETFDSLYAEMDYWYDSMDYDEVLDNMEESFEYLCDEMDRDDIEFIINLYVHKGVIVSAEFWAEDSSDDKVGVILSAQGVKHRLDDVRFSLYDGYSSRPTVVSVAGDHFSKTNFTTTLSYRDGYSSEKITVEWDLKETSSNLRLRYGGESVKMTFAVDGKDVTFKYDVLSWTLGKLDERIETPANTTKIRDVDYADLMELVEPFMDFGIPGIYW